MKVTATLTLASLCCASAFGLHGVATSTAKKVGYVGSNKPMVQAIDVTGQRLSNTMVG